MRTRTAVVAVLTVAAGATVVAVLVGRGSSAEPIESGVALMEALDCDGKPLVVSDGVTNHRLSGTGFLVGTRVLMGVEHMIPPRPGPICGFRARLGGRWYDVVDVKVWSERGEADRRGIDLATATLAEDAPGHLFEFARESGPAGSAATVLGHPLGGPLVTAKAVIAKKLVDYGKPALAVEMTPEPEGGNSGGPILNARGEVVSVFSRILVWANLSPDGKARSGGIDIPRWWGGSVHGDLCRAYPDGGIPACDGAAGGEGAKVAVDVPRYSR